jgi:putative DNA methylase
MTTAIVPFSLKDAPALIERLLPVQKLSAEAYKEQMAGSAKTLTGLGTYWKGRKPLVLNKACVLGCLLPATENPARDLEIFEMLMGMDRESFVERSKRRPTPQDVLGTLALSRVSDYFSCDPADVLPLSSPVDWSVPAYANVNIDWRDDLPVLARRRLESQLLAEDSYRQRVYASRRAEEVANSVHDHIWDEVNAHLGTSARSFDGLVDQLGMMRFGHRPRLADTFCGSGQIPFEAARLGCDVYASDLNPIACMLTWGAFHIVGASDQDRELLLRNQQLLVEAVQSEIDKLGIETDGRGWKAKVFLYCLETRCPQSGWLVPLLPTRVLSKGYRVIADLVPDQVSKRYGISIRSGVSHDELAAAEAGTLRSDGRGQDPYMAHAVGGVEYRSKISTLRGDYRKEDGSNGNRLRQWDKSDFKPRLDDIFQERLYCIQWMRPKKGRKGDDYEFRAPSPDDEKREEAVEQFIGDHLVDWQAKGWIPDMRIEPGDKTDEPIRTRGWTYWHHLWTPRQLLSLALIRKNITSAAQAVSFAGVLDHSSKLGGWTTSSARMSKDGLNKQVGGAQNITTHVFYNQALNTLYAYACRSTPELLEVLTKKLKQAPVYGHASVVPAAAEDVRDEHDVYITDPPYGDAVKYEEILEYFIAWLRRNPPPEFSNWVWDSRRARAIKGEDEDFRRGMVDAYKRMTECMPERGIQVVMFTHQSGTIWADMANIVWASGLQVTAAWYVVTETESALREGSHVKGTVLLVLRKRQGTHKTTRDDLAWEIQEEVEKQVTDLTGLNQQSKGLYRDENVFEDADIQMAGYAAALRVLTRYAVIDGRDMTAEAIRPRVKNETTFVDGLIAFAVDTANQCLVPQGIVKAQWDRLSGAERFYLKMIDMEARGAKTLDNYQNFAKAFKVRDFKPLLASHKANEARLKSAVEFARAEMGEGSELYQSTLRATLYALMELQKNVDGSEVLAHLTLNVPNYYGDMTQREWVAELAEYLAKRLDALRPDEASAARVLRELVKNQRLG